MVRIVTSVCLLACGWATDVKFCLILRSSHHSRKGLLANYLPLSLMIIPGIPKRQTMLCHTNLSILWPVIVATGSASTYLVKYSMATIRNLTRPGAFENGPTMYSLSRIKDPQTLPVPQDEDECEYRHMILTTCHSLYTLSIYHWRMSMSFWLRSSHYLLLIHLLRITRRYVTDRIRKRIPEENEDDGDRGWIRARKHLAPADSVVVVPTDEPVSPPEGKEPVIPPPFTDITIRARITVRSQASISLPPGAKVERLLPMTTPSPSPPISLSPPSAGERLARCMALPAHSSPPPVPSPLLPSPRCPTRIQTLRIASTQALIDAAITALPSPPLPPIPPSLYIPPPVDRRDDVLESKQPPRKRSCLFALGSRYEVGESFIARPTRGRGVDYGFISTVDAEARQKGISEVGYGIRDTWVDLAEVVPEVAPITVGEVNTRVTELAELHEHDTQDMYALLEDAQDMWMVEEEAYASQEAWAPSIELSQATHQELQTYRDHVYAHETHIQAHQTQLQLQGTLIQTHHQAQMVETLCVMRDIRREMGDMQAKLLALREQRRRARQPSPDARILDHQDASRDADSHV
ncbi:hypothetical protein Tco_1493868 [Tanacetum coccineum]